MSKHKTAAPEPEVTGVIPHPVTHVPPHEEALAAIVGAMERELVQGRQFYALPVGLTWGVFYNGQAQVH